MKTLIAEDEVTSQVLLQLMLGPYGPTTVYTNGRDAVEAFHLALEGDDPYDLVCLDIMMPEMDGQTALRHIRNIERAIDDIWPAGVKIIMITALEDKENILAAYLDLSDGYIVKPITREKLLHELTRLGLLPADSPP